MLLRSNRMDHQATMNLSKMHASAAAATGFLKALANEHRLLVLCQLIEGEKSVGELEARLGLRQPHLSQHLARLRRDELVRTRRDSRTIFYSLESRATAETIGLLYKLFCAPAGTSARRGRSRMIRKENGSRHRAALADERPA